MKKIKTEIKNYKLETIKNAGNDLIEYIKDHPETLESYITYVTHETKNELLLYFSKLGQVKQVKHLVEQGANIHLRDGGALCYSAQYGHLELVTYFVEQGADIHVYDDRVFQLSAENGHLEILKYIIKKSGGMQIKTTHINDNNALFLSVRPWYFYALCWSAKNGHLDIVKYLVEHGVNRNEELNEALCWSAEKGQLDVVKYLIEQGADAHANDDYAFHWSSTFGHSDVNNYLKKVINEKNQTNNCES